MKIILDGILKELNFNIKEKKKHIKVKHLNIKELKKS